MPYRPLVSKIRVHNPNRVRASVANKNYIKYIATREGVALDDPENIDSLLEIHGMEKVSMDDQLVHEQASNDNYLRYIACRPRSHGLFGNIDTSDLNTVMKEVSDISKQNRVVFRGVISLSEKDAEALNFRNTAAWNQYLKKVMPGLAKELGVSVTDHTWVAAFHAESSHPHVHYELWDNKDRVKSPFIHTSTQKKCREYLSREMFDNEYEKMIRQVYQEELEELKSVRSIERSEILQKSKEIIEEVIFTPGVTYEVLPDKISHDESVSIKDAVNDLVQMMKDTEHGRVAYKLLSNELKVKVDKVAELLYKRADIQRGMEKYINAVGEMQKYYGKTRTEKESAECTARKDMHTRICNKILKVIKNSYDFSVDKKVTNQEFEKNGSKDLNYQLEMKQERLSEEKQQRSQREEYSVEKNIYVSENNRSDIVNDSMDYENYSKIDGMQSPISDKDNLNRVLTDSYNDIKVNGMKESAESGIKLQVEVGQSRQDYEGIVKKLPDIEGQLDQKNIHSTEVFLQDKKKEIFDVNISYTLVKTVLQDIEKQSRIQRSRASEYNRHNRNHSKQNAIEEYKKNKDNSREPS